ncbi:MAG: hypothetical protein ACTSVY_11415 [Candidatus Helarchaeota archaeon]
MNEFNTTSSNIRELKKIKEDSDSNKKAEKIRKIIENDLNLLIINSEYLEYYDSNTRSLFKQHGVLIDNLFILDKNSFFSSLKMIDQIFHLSEILKEVNSSI